MDLKSLPQNTCPLCREPALALKGDRWKCGHCGCVIEFDADTRHGRITSFPLQYAAIKEALGNEWLTRRELFERVDEARLAAEAEPEAHGSSSLPLGPIAVVALTLLVLCIMLSAIAAAIVVSPAIARTRRAISAAYRPTQTPVPVVEALATEPPVAIESPVLQPTVIPPTESIGVSEAVTATAQLVEAPNLTPTGVLVTPTVALPPTNTPVPPTAFPTAPLPPTVTPTVTPTLGIAATATISAAISPLTSPLAATVTVTPTVAIQQPPPPPPANATAAVTPTVVPNGAVIFNGTLQVGNIKAVGDPNLAEADEYVEIKNIGGQPVYVDGWSLKVFVNNQQRDQFIFTDGAVFAAGQLCRIYTNLAAGPDNCGFAFGFANDEPLWPNNGGARASLFNQQNIEVARFTY